MSTGRIRRSRLLAVLILAVSVALCAAGVRASDNVLGSDKIVGVVGEQIPVDGGWVRVDEIQVGQTLIARDRVKARTEGLFVVVRVSVAATGPAKLRFGKAKLVTRMRTYDLWLGTMPTAVTGFSTSTQVEFEVDPTEIDDLTIVLERANVVTQYEELVAVALGITADNAAAWRRAGQGRSVPLESDDRTAALR